MLKYKKNKNFIANFTQFHFLLYIENKWSHIYLLVNNMKHHVFPYLAVKPYKQKVKLLYTSHVLRLAPAGS